MPEEGKQIRVGFAQESTFGSPTADGGTFTEIACEPLEMERDIKVHELTTKSGGRQGVYQDRVINAIGTMPRFTVKGPFSRNESDVFFYSFLQKVTEASGTPYLKNFDYFDTQPEFSSDLGKFLTFIKRYPTSSTSWKATSCIAEKIKLECERGGMLMLETGFVANGAISLTSNPSGTWERGLDAPGGSDDHDDAYGLLFFNNIDIATLNFDGAGANTVTLQRFMVELEHTVEGTGPDGSGGWTNYGISDYRGTVEIEFLKDARFELAMSSQESDGYFQFNLNWGAATAAVDGELELIVTAKLLESPTVNEDGLITGVLKGEILAANSSSDGFLLNMSNVIDRTW